MINEKMQAALNEQINAEFYSSYIYLSMAAYFDSENLPGFSSWMKVQAQEEVSHAMILFNYVCERGGRVLVEAIEKPDTEWESTLAAFEAAYNHECKVSGLINNLVDLALELRDHATNAMLQWFVSEQVEEENSADDIVQKLKRASGNPNAILMLDSQLAARVFTMPSQLAAE